MTYVLTETAQLFVLCEDDANSLLQNRAARNLNTLLHIRNIYI